MSKEYMGDSVYADVEDGMLKLTTENGFPQFPSNIIYLDENTLDALLKYIDRLGVNRKN